MSTAAIFGAPVMEPPGKVAWRSVGEAGVRPEGALDERHHVLDARKRLGRHELRPAHASRDAHPGEVVALEVDDHHVLGGVLRRGVELGRPSGRTRALDRHRPDPVVVAGEEELGRRGDDRPPVTLEQTPAGIGQRPGPRLGQRAEPGGERRRLPLERRREVLDEVDLVDVSATDRPAHGGHRVAVLGLRPRVLPVPDLEALRHRVFSVVRPGNGCASLTDDAARQRQPARLRWRRRAVASDRL